ncbi:MAG: hypothetical protein Q8Q52_07230 [Acidimicrobiia bacterium]|nr:hypothetical protein [Acidimicrobiia bacterium]
MDIDDFFIESPPGPFGPGSTRLNTDRLTDLRKGPVPGHADIDVAQALSQLVHQDLVLYGTSGGATLDNPGMQLALRAMRAVGERLGIDVSVPFRDFDGFYAYWIREGAKGSWQARRDLLSEIFEPMWAELDRLEDTMLAGGLAEAVSPRAATGWSTVDTEIHELRRRFRSATSPQDYRAVGTHCVGVLEALSRTVYDHEVHLREGEDEPAPDKTKQRIGRFVEDAVPGRDNSEVRSLATKAIDLAQAVKHRTTPTRRDAGIAADAVILLANICRRLGVDDGSG